MGGVLLATCVPCLRVKLRFMFANSVLLRIAVPESDRELVFKKDAFCSQCLRDTALTLASRIGDVLSEWVETAGLADLTFHLDGRENPECLLFVIAPEASGCDRPIEIRGWTCRKVLLGVSTLPVES